MKITIPFYMSQSSKERAEFKRQMVGQGIKFQLHGKDEFPYIWSMYNTEDYGTEGSDICVITFNSGVRKVDAKKRLLTFLQEEWLCMKPRKFMNLIKDRILLEDPEQENTLFFNFHRLEKLLY